MNHLFVPYHIALLLKEKGFSEECLGLYRLYNNHQSLELKRDTGGWYKNSFINKFDAPEICTAPTYEQVFDWIRTVYKLHISINPIADRNDEFEVAIWDMKDKNSDGYAVDYIVDSDEFYVVYKEHSEAKIKAIEKVLKNE